jgi:hypothetical protein
MNTECLNSLLVASLDDRSLSKINELMPIVEAHISSDEWLKTKNLAVIDGDVIAPPGNWKLLFCLLLHVAGKDFALNIAKDQFDFSNLYISYDKSVPAHCIEVILDRGELSIKLFGGEAFEAPWFVCSRLADIIPLIICCGRDAYLSAKFYINMHDAGGDSEASFCSNCEAAVLIPDIYFVGSLAYRAERESFSRRELPWSEKVPVAFWRGSTTGHAPSGWQSLPRVKLCAIGRDSPGGDFDCGITAQVFPITDVDYQEIAAAGLTKSTVSSLEFDRYRYHIDIDGNSNSWPGLFIKLLTGSPVLKVASPGNYRQWYYGNLIPWENYVPVSSDMCDINSKLKWLFENQDKAQEIGRAGRALAESMSMSSQIQFCRDQFNKFFRN